MDERPFVERYPEILDVPIGPPLARSVKELVSLLPGPLPWRTFSRIPAGQRQVSRLRAVMDRWEALVPGRRNAFLRDASTHERLLKRLEAHGKPHEFFLFRFLCLGEPVPRIALEAYVGNANIKRFVEHGVLLQRNGRVLLPTSLVPFDDGYYLAESRHILSNRSAYGIGPAFIGEGTDHLVRFLRTFTRRHRVRSMLEMGCGIGIATLQMQHLIRSRHGAEIHERNLAFALANQELRNDRDVRFYKSDLFSAVTGTFDLVVFNPWTPTVRYLDLVSRFIREAPRFLNDGGNIVLFISTCLDGPRDSTLERIRRILTEQSLTATRHYNQSYFERDGDGHVTLCAGSFLEITRRSQQSSDAMRTKFNVGRMQFGVRRLLRGAVGRVAH